MASMTTGTVLGAPSSTSLTKREVEVNRDFGSKLLEAIQFVTMSNDNLDLGCALIEKAATEKEIQTIGEIAQHLSISKKHRVSVGPTFFYANLYAQCHVVVLPEAVRPKPCCLLHSQQLVYEENESSLLETSL